MLRMCIPIFVSGEAVVLDSGFFVAKGITELESKGVYAAALIKKRRHWPEVVHGDLIDTHFEDKEVVYVVIIEVITEYNKLFTIFCMKEPYCVMKRIASWMTLNELEGSSTRRYFTDSSGTKEAKNFTYWKPFGFHFRYRHQVDDSNIWRHAYIYLERTWFTKSWSDRNFAWYLPVSELNTALASGQFQNYMVVQPSLEFGRVLAMDCL